MVNVRMDCFWTNIRISRWICWCTHTHSSIISHLTHFVMYINYIYEARKTKYTTTKKLCHLPSSFLWICYAFGKGGEKGKRLKQKSQLMFYCNVLSFEWNETAWNKNEEVRTCLLLPIQILNNVQQHINEYGSLAFRLVWFIRNTK